MRTIMPLPLLFIYVGLFVSCFSPLLASAHTQHLKWEVSYMFSSPDCQEKLVMAINGQFPGPTIRAKAGDTVVVELKNSLPTEGVVIHWHGIRQIGTPWADGTALISQCPIKPDETFIYKFQADKAGTYFYHGHYGMQRAAGLYGLLIVDVKDGEKEKLKYDGEINMILSDWYHQDIYSQMVGLSSNPFRWIGEPQSLLINGVGQFNCSLAANQGKDSCNIEENGQCAPVVFPVSPNKTYRLRIVSTTSLSSLNLAIGDHRLTVVEADGNYIDPFTVDDIDIYSGESYSVLITTNQVSSNYWISVGVRGRQPKTPPALAILNYLKNPQILELPKAAPPATPAWNDYGHSKSFSYRIRAVKGAPKPPQRANRRILLLNTQSKIDGVVKWSVNNVSMVLQPTPYLGSLRYSLKGAFDQQRPRDWFGSDYDVMRPPVNPNSTSGSNLYTIKFNSTVDIILQNANALAENVSEIHPWHLHGHDFWVLGYGEGMFKKKEHVIKFNLEDAPLRNTAVIFPYGWTAIRFVADNPGAWAFHCHIEPHLHMGMGMVFAEGIELVKEIPKEAISCGRTATMFMNKKYHP